MKISKLFHWLYALVMLLPIFAIGVTCGYAMFNKNAYQSYYGDTINEVSYDNISLDDLEIGETYHFSSNLQHETLTNTGLYYLKVANVRNIETNYVNSIDTTLFDALRMSDYTNNYLLLLDSSNNTVIYTINLSTYTIIFDFDFVYYSYPVNVPISTYFDSCIYKINYNKNSFISEVFYYSIDRVQQSPLFNWAYNSFLVTPFAYIVSLFSMPTNSFVVMLLSYWLAISIIWLVFDLVMYVPLLVHRWLDKGVLE